MVTVSPQKLYPGGLLAASKHVHLNLSTLHPYCPLGRRTNAKQRRANGVSIDVPHQGLRIQDWVGDLSGSPFVPAFGSVPLWQLGWLYLSTALLLRSVECHSCELLSI